MGKRKIIIYLGIILVSATTYWAINYFAIGKNQVPYSQNSLNQDQLASEKVDYVVEEFVSGLEVPWSIVWTDPQRMLIAERPGRLRVALNGKLQEKPLITFEDVSSKTEEGLMGLTVDPAYPTNQFLYACYAYEKNDEIQDRVVRLKDLRNKIEIDKVLLDSIPAAQFHAGCRLAFGPDKKLYITTGDATDRNLAQKKDSLAGKILRLNPDGSIPDDNPFRGNLVWSFGHRNSQGLAWHPLTKELYETEHGPSVFDGPAGGDEVNLTIKGGNYGWPLVSHENQLDGAVSPLLVFTPAEAPASAAFYTSDKIPQFKNNLFFGALKGEGLIRIIFDKDNPNKVVSYEKLSEVQSGRIRAVAEGPDGYLYFGNSNRDGRGKPDPKDDRIFRLKTK